jgi:ribosomal protein L11 methyltransferase
MDALQQACPYDELYIYHLNGEVDEQAEGEFGSSFIGNWVEDNESFLFFGAPVEAEMVRFLERRPAFHVQDFFQMPYSQWQSQGLCARVLGSFLVAPPWDCSKPIDSQIRLTIDPGVVFGSGDHPTTQHCLEALELVFAKGPCAAVLDLGTGTGVLSLAAAALGAKKVLAVDINRLAVQTARKNIAYNNMADRVEALAGKAQEHLRPDADLLMANIHYTVMKEIVARPEFEKVPWAILSGLLRSQFSQIVWELEKMGASVVKVWDKDQTWFTMLCRNRHSC